MADSGYTDDPTIADDAILWRRIPPFHVVNDQNLGRLRPTTDSFVDDSDSPMSVALVAPDVTSAVVLAGHPGFALAEFTAGFARHRCNQLVVRAPRPGEPWHAFVVGKKTDSVRKKFARESQWAVPPSGT